MPVSERDSGWEEAGHRMACFRFESDCNQGPGDDGAAPEDPKADSALWGKQRGRTLLPFSG